MKPMALLGGTEMETETFRVAYDGPALEDHTIDARDLAPALLALSELIESSNHALNENRACVTLRVGAFRPNGFDIGLLISQDLAAAAVALLAADAVTAIVNARDLLAIIGLTGRGGLVGLLRWLRGRRISSIRPNEGTPGTVIVNVSGDLHVHGDVTTVQRDQYVTDARTLPLYQSRSVREAIAGCIQRPLQRDGIERFKSGLGTAEPDVVVTRDDAPAFEVPEVEEERLDSSRFETTVQIARIEFNDQNKWRFSDGDSQFYATIADPLFLDKINHNVASFSKGDLLRVRVLKEQRNTRVGLKSDYTILEVLEHRRGAVQIPLPLGVTPHPN